MPTDHDLDSYDYELPAHLIAQEPRVPRDTSRLLVVHRSKGTWEHRTFRELPTYLDSQDWMVANNTRVLKARLLGYRIRQESFDSGRGAHDSGWKSRFSVSPGARGGRVEFVLLEKLQDRVWEGLFRASARALAGFRFEIPIASGGPPLQGKLIRGSAESPSGTVVVEFDRDPVSSGAGEVPLPHYIQRSPERLGDGLGDGKDDPRSRSRSADEAHYQTLYAKHLGSAAAPTAGLHFTSEVMDSIKKRGTGWDELTLHVGIGTFRPVKAQKIENHVMHEERYEISPLLAQSITDWKAAGKRVVAVGTTSVRALESAVRKADPLRSEAGDPSKWIQPGVGRTSIFIRPGIGFQFQVVDRLITNFHLPRSTLLMLVCALAGRELTLAAYREAVEQGYRFYSYGDAMLILE